jgi:hypothetical protein
MRFSIPILKHAIPRRAKVTVVVGNPIDFEGEQDVEKCHEQYLHHLNDFYKRERAMYGYENIDLELI